MRMAELVFFHIEPGSARPIFMHRPIITLILAAFFWPAFAVAAPPPDSPTTTGLTVLTPIKAAYLRDGLEVPLPAVALDALPAYLQGDAALSQAMAQAGRSGILIYQIDTFQEMFDRLNHQEFDFAYCPARILVEQSAGYVPILQIRPANVIADSTHNRMIAWQGVIIGSRTAAPFKSGTTTPTDSELAAWFRENTMAFPSAYSAVGYIYPLLTLRRRFGVEQPGGFIFLNSSREVARAVVNGLIPAGACEEGALHEVIAEIPPVNGEPWKAKQVVRILAHTSPVPTDPIIARAELAPERSSLGLALRDALRRYHENTAGLPRVGESAAVHFGPLREDMQLFRQSEDLGLQK